MNNFCDCVTNTLVGDIHRLVVLGGADVDQRNKVDMAVRIDIKAPNILRRRTAPNKFLRAIDVKLAPNRNRSLHNIDSRFRKWPFYRIFIKPALNDHEDTLTRKRLLRHFRVVAGLAIDDLRAVGSVGGFEFVGTWFVAMGMRGSILVDAVLGPPAGTLARAVPQL